MEPDRLDMAVGANCSIDVAMLTECSPEITETPSNKTKLTTIQRFYAGQSVLITGGTGFIGKLLIEKLLRCCPDIFIYLLIRPKKDKNIYQRAEETFDDAVFCKLKDEVPNFRQQLVFIAGDCSLSGLGISAADRTTLNKEVSIVFHVAATVNLNANLKQAVAINVQGPRNILSLSKEMPNLKSVVFVSTAFSNCPQRLIEEKFYEPPIEAEKLISLMNCLNENLANDITPRILGEWPNTYTYTKAVAESTVKKEAGVLPIGIFRPSIVVSTYQEPIQGWIDNQYGPTGVIACSARGLLRTLHCDGSLKANLIPGDFTVNALIACAWDVANTPRHNPDNSDIPIYNYINSENFITWSEFMVDSAKYGLEEPSIKAVWYYSFNITKWKFLHQFYIYSLHFLPAILIDIVTLCFGNKPRLFNIYKKIHKFLDALNYFSMREWEFSNSRISEMLNKLETDDKDMFFFNMKDLVWEKFFQTYSHGIRVYIFKDPVDTLPQARIKWRRMYWMHQALKLLLSYIFMRTSWSVITKILFLSRYYVNNQ